jgi:RNA polymerase sigma factor (TIGR02999 family)
MTGGLTQILSAIEDGDPHAAEQLLPVVYDELRTLAAQSKEESGQTLQATALVHEAYVRLVDAERAQHWNSRGHFLAAAAEAIRRILIENARCKKVLRRGDHRQRLNLDLAEPAASERSGDLLALDEALETLAAKDEGKVQLVKLRYFAGLTMEQAAESLGISLATANRWWNWVSGLSGQPLCRVRLTAAPSNRTSQRLCWPRCDCPQADVVTSCSP